MDLWTREARLFKYGSGTGTNFSNVRGEGEPPERWRCLEWADEFPEDWRSRSRSNQVGWYHSRRAAKMVCLDLDHPDIESFIKWKAEEENKVRALVDAGYSPDFNGEAYATVSGQKQQQQYPIPHSFLKAVEDNGDWNQVEQDLIRLQDRMRRTCGKISATPPGNAQTPGFSLMTPSTSGTPVQRVEPFEHPTHAVNTCSWMIRHVTSPA